MLLKCCTQYVSKFGKLINGCRTGKSQFSSQFQRRAMPKNVQTTTQFCSFHMLIKLILKILQARLQQYVNQNIQMYKLGLEKAEIPELKLPTSTATQEKQGNSRKTSTSASLIMLNPLTVWITTNCGKFLKRWKYQTTLPVF